MAADLAVCVLSGPVTVAYTKTAKEWTCTALEFDLVGFGKTKDDAFDALRGVVNTYLDAALETPGPIQFFHPADGKCWNAKHKERYDVIATAECS